MARTNSSPSYESIAEHAHCGRTTVYQAINALERAGILSWVNRIARVREWGPDLFGRAQNRWRVIRTSNQYCFVDPKNAVPPREPSKFKFGTGTEDQELFPTAPRRAVAAKRSGEKEIARAGP